MKEYCERVLEEVYLFLDGEISDDTHRAEIQAHLEECRPCLERYGLEREVGQLLHRLSGNCRCPESLKARIVLLIDEA